MIAEVVSVGTELLMGQIADTDAQHLGKMFPELGIDHYHRQTVGDNMGRLVAALRLALSRADVVFTIGGLGPTKDDITRDAVAEVVGEELMVDPEALQALKDLFAFRKIEWTETQERQAMCPASARMIVNPNGTAPGLLCEKHGKAIISLPGPRGEFIPMANGPVRDYLMMRAGGGEIIHSRILRVAGMGESMVEQKVGALMDSSNPTVAPYAQPGEVFLRLTAKAPNRDLADALLDPVEARIRSVLGDAVYAEGDVTLEQAVVDMLKGRNETVSVAESITGGWLGQRFTSVPGGTAAFIGGVITYQKCLKETVLNVDSAILDDPSRGPVDPEVAIQMATNVRKLCGATYGVSLTGNAGPTTDEGDKPVGMVYIGIAWEGGHRVEQLQFKSQREDIRYRSTHSALTLLRQVMLARHSH